MKLLYIFMLILFIFNPVNAMDNINSCEIGTNCNIGEYVYNDTYTPYTNQICSIYIQYPNVTLAVNGGSMSNSSDGYHNYTYVAPVTGYYRTYMSCVNGTDSSKIDKSFVATTASIYTLSTTNLNSINQVGTDVNQTRTYVTQVGTDVNQTRNIVTQTGANINDTFTIEITNFGSTTTSNNYTITIISRAFNNSLINLTTVPTITIYDSENNIIINSNNTIYISYGLYNFSYTLLDTDVGGTWKTVVSGVKDGINTTNVDYWTVSSSPADVIINSIIDNTIPSIVASVDISNMGTQGSDFEYAYCIVENINNLCGGGDDVDYRTSTRFITAGATWEGELILTVPSAGMYYFKVKTKALNEIRWVGSIIQFTAVKGTDVGAQSITSVKTIYVDTKHYFTNNMFLIILFLIIIFIMVYLRLRKRYKKLKKKQKLINKDKKNI